MGRPEVYARHGNRLLSAVDEAAFAMLEPHLEAVDLEVRDTVIHPDRPIEHVYFPSAGVLSIVSNVNGGSVEVATVGNEGFVGVPVFLGAVQTNLTAFCQVSASAQRMPAETFRRVVGEVPALADAIARYAQALFVQVAQSAACNRAHDISERCSRWLLQTHDRVEGDTFELTQEFLAQMLGVRRPTVNVAARMLQQAGLVSYVRGRMTIVDREGLEAASCECYAIIRREFDRLIPPSGGRGPAAA